MRRQFALVLLAGLLASQAAGAVEYAECHDCTVSEYQSTALRHQPLNGSSHNFEIYVADVERQQLTRFRVATESEPGLRFRYARKLAPAADELASFHAYLEARSAVLEGLDRIDFTFEIPAGFLVGSAYDLWGSNRNRLLVQEFINAELSFLERAFSNFFASASFLLNRNVSKLLVKVRFPDGSMAYFQLTGNEEDLVWSYLESQSLDADGNQIPDRLLDFSEYAGVFNSTSVSEFLLRAALYGIPIIDKGNGTSQVAVVCVQDASGNYSCVVTTVN